MILLKLNVIVIKMRLSKREQLVFDAYCQSWGELPDSLRKEFRDWYEADGKRFVNGKHGELWLKKRAKFLSKK